MRKLYARMLVFWGLFGGVPLCLALFLGLYAISIQETYEREIALTELDGDLSNIVRHLDAPAFLQKRFSALTRRLYKRRFDPDHFAKVWRWTQKKWGFTYEPYVFDSAGNLITPNSIPLKSKYMVTKLWRIHRNVQGTKDVDIDKFKVYFTPLLGPGFRIDHLDPSRGFILPFATDRKGSVFWEADPGNQFGGILIIAYDTPSSVDLLKVYSRKPLKKSLSLIVAKNETTLSGFWGKLDENEMENVWKECKLQRAGSFFFQGRGWVSIEARGQTFLAGRSDEKLDFKSVRRGFVLAILAFALLIGVFWWRWIVLGREIYVSIRLKLVLLFLFSVLVPLMGVSFLGFRMLKDREEILVTEAGKAAKDVLIKFDSDFLHEKEIYLRLFRSVRDDVDLKSDFPRFRKRLHSLHEKFLVQRCDMLDINGKLFFTLDKESTKGRIGPMIMSMAKMNIEKHLPERLAPQQKQSTNPMDVIAREVFLNPEFGYLELMSHPDEIHDIRIVSNKSNWIYWDVFHQPDHPAAYIQLYQDINDAYILFLKKRLARREGHLQGGFRIMAHRDGARYWYPSRAMVTSEIETVMERVRISQQPVQSRFVWKGSPYLAMGFPGKNIGNHSLMALYPEEEISRDIKLHRKWLFFMMGVALFVSILTGVILSETFLDPISELAKGIQALRRKDTSYRVPSQQKDELGDLSHLFNRMMEDSAEMQFAKVVQESLIPQEMPKCPGFEFELFNTTASDLGGDYCDILTLKDGRVLFVIGDVTGHGVSAALLMAMAKSVVFFFSQEPGTPADLVNRLNVMVAALLKRHKLMTLFAGILDPKTGKLTFCNAGHPFPFILRADGTIFDIKMVNYPLGVSIKKKFPDGSVDLLPEDVLVMYTDGIVETTNAVGEQLGYGNFKNKALPLRELSSQEIRRNLFQLFLDHHGTGAPDDDVTLIIIKRLSPPRPSS